MVEYVFKPVRKRRGGRRVESRVWYGRYSLGRGFARVTVPLHVTDEAAAKAKLRALVVEKERERAGIVAPRAIREAAGASLSDLLAQYATDLRARTKPAHADESLARIRRVLSATGWRRLIDITPSSWVAFRAGLKRSAKTVKEYQTSVMAWLNWLVRMDMMHVNPLAKVDAVKIRGKAVRKSRAFTEAEFARLIAAAPAGRRLVYLFLAYTGVRKNEARTLRWADVDLGERPSITLAEENTKGARKRVLPLKVELADMLRGFASLPRDPIVADMVFDLFPSDDALHADLAKAGIERKDASGRVVHFHAFRKTFQTWGAVAGVGQRSAQEMLGHSDPSLTAGVYTDAAALRLHDEVAKLPWLGENGAPSGAPESVQTGHFDRFRALCGELVNLAQVVVSEGKSATSGASLLGCPTWIRTMTR